MTAGNGKKEPRDGGRAERLAQALRQNLQKRKTQARSRRQGEADARPEGVDAARPAKR